MALDLIEVKRTLESLNASHGAGKVFYVCPDGASETYRSDFIGIQKVAGQVHSTVASAVSSCVSNRGDIVVVFPGTYTQGSGALTLDKNGMTLMGLPGRRDLTLLKTGVIDEHDAGGEPGDIVGFNTIDITGTGCTVKDLTVSNGWFDSDPAAKTRICLTAQAEGATISGCKFTFDTAAGSALNGVSIGGSNCKVLDCLFDNCITGGSAVFLEVAHGDVRNPLIEGCSFVGVNKNADSNFCIGAAATSANEIFGLLIKGCVFDPSGTGGGGGEDMLQLINGTGGKSYEGMIVDCIFGVDVSAAGDIGNVGTTLRFAGCFGTNGLSTGQPA